MIVRTAIITFVIPMICIAAEQPDFASLRRQNPKLDTFLTLKMEEYGGGPIHSYTAKDFTSSTTLWSSSDKAIIWATAQPPTEATASKIGVVILATLHDKHWIVSDSICFTATGKYCEAKAEITSSASTLSYDDPVITITLFQGGRGYSYSEAFTYSLDNGKFILHKPNEKSKNG